MLPTTGPDLSDTRIFGPGLRNVGIQINEVGGVLQQGNLITLSGGMIGHGADGTAAHPDGYNGGWLIGTGGNGVDGGSGGNAGFIGNGGAGSAGAAGQAVAGTVGTRCS